jgi:hypothetical protein
MKDGNQLAGTLGSALDPDGNKRCRTLTLNTETAVRTKNKLNFFRILILN